MQEIFEFLPHGRLSGSFEPEVDKDTAKILVVLLQAMVQLLDVFLFQETDDAFLELAAALARDDLNELDPLGYGLIDHAVKLRINGIALVENIMEVEFELGHFRL